jgi:hypothetical protein
MHINPNKGELRDQIMKIYMQLTLKSSSDDQVDTPIQYSAAAAHTN